MRRKGGLIRPRHHCAGNATPCWREDVDKTRESSAPIPMAYAEGLDWSSSIFGSNRNYKKMGEKLLRDGQTVPTTYWYKSELEVGSNSCGVAGHPGYRVEEQVVAGCGGGALPISVPVSPILPSSETGESTGLNPVPGAHMTPDLEVSVYDVEIIISSDDSAADEDALPEHRGVTPQPITEAGSTSSEVEPIVISDDSASEEDAKS